MESESCLSIYLSQKSLLKQIVNILDMNLIPTSLELINSLVEMKINIMEKDKLTLSRQNLNVAISYLLENINSNQNRTLLQNFLTWESDIQKRVKRPKLK
jgi:hypothetical protein